ncbi:MULTISPECIES: helix-turn-helix domain-containing protein [Citricoccus]|uniref:helix-turn-helix domain-containing protein n=1 Tax=Citricoccus TaxID=169133 RepID=UPI000255F07C|nr:XRE family transcriptional regulator [Citricoccus sp. CH26A]
MKSLPIQPTVPDRAIGGRLRALRQERRLTMDQVAEFSGLTKGFLSRVERDLTSPSVASLVAICQVLGVSAGEILDAPQTAVVRLENAPRVNLGGDGISEQLLTPPGRRGLQLIRAVIAPGGRGDAELYTVDCDVESLHVISGSLVFITTGGEVRLEAGDTASFSGSEPHSWSNPGEREAVVLWALAGRRLS